MKPRWQKVNPFILNPKPQTKGGARFFISEVPLYTAVVIARKVFDAHRGVLDVLNVSLTL
jgi:hypothetical protein